MAEACARVEGLLSALVDGELAEDEREAVRTHLRGCERCAAAVADLRGTRALLRSLPVRRAPDVVALAPAAPQPYGAASILSRSAIGLAVAGGLLAGAVFALGEEPAEPVPAVRLPVDVFVADHVIHTLDGPVVGPVPVGLQP